MNKIIVGDCREVMRGLIADGEKVQMCVTSPPYWGLRDYGVAGQLGLESTPQEYVANMVGVFRLVRDLLVDNGTCWINLGDSYAGSGRGGHVSNTSTLEGSIESEQKCRMARGSQLAPGLHAAAAAAGVIGRAWVSAPAGFKQKDRMMMPARVAIALHADGWWLRDEIVWQKTNPMPSSVEDRTTPAHEMIYLLSKKARYFYDADAIAEPVNGNPNAPRNKWDTKDYEVPGQKPQKRTARTKVPGGWDRGEGAHGTIHRDGRTSAEYQDVEIKATRNKRSVWPVPTSPYPEAHFATFPPALIEPCILAGSRAGDIVFDPFMGSGTTGEVAQRLGRNWLGCELNPEYVKLAEKRTGGTIGMAFA